MGKRDKEYGLSESEWHHPTYTPKWLTRQPSPGARYCVINGVAFEVVAGRYFGYFIDRISMSGDYLGETCWVEHWVDAKRVMADWDSRPQTIPEKYEVEDIYGNDDDTPTAIGRAKRRRANSSGSKFYRDKKKALVLA